MIRTIISSLKFKGKNRLIKFIFPGVRREIVSYFNSKIYVDTSEHIGWNIYWNKGYEQEVIWALDKYVSSDSVCLDIGANIGVYTIPLAEKSKKVIAFEPHPDFANRLKRNLELNRFNNVEIRSIALSNQPGNAILHSPPPKMSNKSATLREINFELTDSFTVQLSTLDKEISEKVDFIKIDTDGSDGNIILGGKELISKYHPVILFEYLKEFKEIEQEYKEAVNFLENQQYVLYEVNDHYLTHFNFNIVNFANVIAIPSEFSAISIKG